jgi:hypothetical protein
VASERRSMSVVLHELNMVIAHNQLLIKARQYGTMKDYKFCHYEYTECGYEYWYSVVFE